jgi:hypothetical protein
MALTFGTLLSSQGADAHHPEPFGSIRGNLWNATRSVSQCQTDPARPAPTDQWRLLGRFSVLVAVVPCSGSAPVSGLRSPCRQNISRGVNTGQIRGGNRMHGPYLRASSALTREIFSS